MSQQLLAFAAWAAANPQLVNEPEIVSRAYQSFFASEHGRIILADLVARHKIMSPSYAPGASHADTAFFEGMKQVVAQILSEALVDNALANFLQSTPGAAHERPNNPILD